MHKSEEKRTTASNIAEPPKILPPSQFFKPSPKVERTNAVQKEARRPENPHIEHPPVPTIRTLPPPRLPSHLLSLLLI